MKVEIFSQLSTKSPKSALLGAELHVIGLLGTSTVVKHDRDAALFSTQSTAHMSDGDEQAMMSDQKRENPRTESIDDWAMNPLTVPQRRSVSNVVIVSSPKAGSGLGREQLPNLVERLAAAGFAVCSTSDIDVLRRQTQDTHADPDDVPVVIAAGGDGTLSLVAENVPPAVPILPMPLGTENLVARHFGHSADPREIVAAVQNGASHWLDAGEANGKLFLAMVTCGFDAEVVRAMHLTRRGHIRRFHYAGPIFRALCRYRFPKIKLRVEDTRPNGQTQTQEVCWAMTFNLPCYGGHLKIEPNAVGDDGLLDVITFRKGSILSGLRYVIGIACRQHHRYWDVVRSRGNFITLTSDHRVPYQLDGDYGGHLPLKIKLLPGRVHLLLPERSEG